MNNYSEDKKKLEAIRNNWEYCTKGDILFRTAMLMVFEAGFDHMKEKEFLDGCLYYNNEKHDKAEAEGKILFCTREFDEAIYKCAHEIAQIPIMSVLMYSQREIFFYDDWTEPSYKELLNYVKSAMSVIEVYNNCFNEETKHDFINCLEMSEEHIEFFGFGYLFDNEEEWEE